jgi:hypothetical protein
LVFFQALYKDRSFNSYVFHYFREGYLRDFWKSLELGKDEVEIFTRKGTVDLYFGDVHPSKVMEALIDFLNGFISHDLLHALVDWTLFVVGVSASEEIFHFSMGNDDSIPMEGRDWGWMLLHLLFA